MVTMTKTPDCTWSLIKYQAPVVQMRCGAVKIGVTFCKSEFTPGPPPYSSAFKPEWNADQRCAVRNGTQRALTVWRYMLLMKPWGGGRPVQPLYSPPSQKKKYGFICFSFKNHCCRDKQRPSAHQCMKRPGYEMPSNWIILVSKEMRWSLSTTLYASLTGVWIDLDMQSP